MTRTTSGVIAVLAGGVLAFLAMSSGMSAFGQSVTVLRGGGSDKVWEAVIKFGSNHSRSVTTRAKTYYEARDNFESLYCPDRDCIIEGPWERR